MTSSADRMVDPAIFQALQSKIDDDVAVREELKAILGKLEKQTRASLSVLARAHSTPQSRRHVVVAIFDALAKPVPVPALADEAERSLQPQIEQITELAKVASKHPYYQYNAMWTKHVQDTCFAILYSGWLGAFGSASQNKLLLTLEDVGSILRVPVNPDKDEFHVSIEEYLHALISLIDELARLAVNAVTLGDYRRPLQIAQFIKDVHAGFQILNLKNDSLRRKSDSIKYSVKKVEDVVYDLSLRNLISKDDQD